MKKPSFEVGCSRKPRFLKLGEFLQKKSLISGDLLTDAQVRIDSQFNQPYVAIEFNSLGARLFDQATAANVGKRFAIVLDNNIFTGFSAGASLTSSTFVSGTSPVAGTTNPTVLYNTGTGALSFDADGSGAGGAVVFAYLTTTSNTHPTISATDFIIL